MRFSRPVPRAVPITIRSEVVVAGTWSMRAAACGVIRRQTKLTPTVFQIAAASSSTRGISRGGISVVSVTVMTSGGSGEAVEAAASVEAIATAAARLAVISIAAIDGRNQQKFDVR